MAIGTTAPMALPHHLLALWRTAAVDDHALARPWLGEGDAAVWFSRAAWGLKAVVDGHRATLQRPPRLWLPDYFCNQATWPLRVSDVELVFYPVGTDLQPDWQRCERLAAAGAPDLFVVVHYFGFAADLATAGAFCKAHGAALIEDAAHVLAPAGEIGRRGDYVLYSLYKHFAIPDGGLLVVRPSASPARAAILASPTTHAPAPGAAIWLAKRLVQGLLPFAAARLRRHQNFADDPEDQPMPRTSGLSGIARRLLHRAAPNLTAIAAIAEARRVNERALRTALVTAPGITPLFAAPGNDTAPYRAVFRADTLGRAAACFGRFQAAGNVVESWPDLPPEVRGAPAAHRAALALRQTVLALPVHASWSEQELAAAYGGVL